MDWKMIKRRWVTLRLTLMHSPYKKAAYLKKHHILGSMGENCSWFPNRIPAEAELVHLGNNVVVATEVCFFNHDATAGMLNRKYHTDRYTLRRGEVHIGDNVFIGGRSTILYDVNIGSNVIIGAGSVVMRDVPDNTVAAGVPARYIKSFEAYKAEMDERFVKPE